MKIYVGTYAKYNNGSIAGEWLDLSEYTDKDDFYAACAELHKDEDDPEFMFQDHEDIPSGMVSESHIDAEAWDLLEAFQEHDEGAVLAFIDWYGNWDADKFTEAYNGEWGSEREFAEDLFDKCGYGSEMPDHLQIYFDYDAFARDLFICDYTMQGDHVFRADI